MWSDGGAMHQLSTKAPPKRPRRKMQNLVRRNTGTILTWLNAKPPVRGKKTSGRGSPRRQQRAAPPGRDAHRGRADRRQASKVLLFAPAFVPPEVRRSGFVQLTSYGTGPCVCRVVRCLQRPIATTANALHSNDLRRKHACRRAFWVVGDFHPYFLENWVEWGMGRSHFDNVRCVNPASYPPHVVRTVHHRPCVVNPSHASPAALCCVLTSPRSLCLGSTVGVRLRRLCDARWPG